MSVLLDVHAVCFSCLALALAYVYWRGSARASKLRTKSPWTALGEGASEYGAEGGLFRRAMKGPLSSPEGPR